MANRRRKELTIETDLLKPKEAAEFLGVEPRTLANWRAQRRGPAHIAISSRLVRYRLADLEAYAASLVVEAAR
jgi:predicted DNA-binding transcriptional regulator AlpA